VLIAKGRIITWSKWTLIVVAGMFALLALAAFVLTSVIDPNRYRGKVEGIVADLAGRPFVIEGDLQITWFPWLGVRIGRAHLSNPPGTAGPPLAEWQSMAVAAKVLPLLKGQIIVDRVRLQGPHVHLRRDAQGHGNWENLGLRASPSPSGKGQVPPEIAGIEISDGELDYVDEVSNLHLNLSSWRFETGEWRTGIPLAVHTRFLARSDSVSGPAGIWVQIDSAQLTTQFSPLSVTTPKLSVRVADAQLDGPLKLQDTLDTQSNAHHLVANGSITLHVPAVRKLASDFGLEASLPKDPTSLGKLDSTSEWSFKDGVLSVNRLTLQLDGTRLDGWLEHSAPPQAAWRFELHGDQIDLGRYTDLNSSRKRKPFELPVKALRAINANGTLKFDQVRLANTHMSDVRLRIQTPEERSP
jgi:AsmA protein